MIYLSKLGLEDFETLYNVKFFKFRILRVVIYLEMHIEISGDL